MARSNNYKGKGQTESKGKKFSGKKPTSREYVEGGKGYERTERGATNAVEWYAKNAGLVRDTSSIPFGYATGKTTGATGVQNEIIPGIVSLEYTMVPGGCYNNPNAPVNVAARALYTEVRKANAGATNYDPANLQMYMLAMDSAFALHAWMQRVYGTLNLYSVTNRYYPKVLVEAQKASFTDLLEHLAEFRAFINIYAAKLSQFAVPGKFTYMVRHYWLASHYFVDADTSKSQIFIYCPDSFWKYNESVSPAQLDRVELSPGGSLLTFEQIKTFANALLDEILMSQDLVTMSGDILKRFETSELLTIGRMEEDFTELPSFSHEVLSQVENAICMPGLVYGPILEIVSDLEVDPYLSCAINTPTLTAEPTQETSSYRVPDGDWANRPGYPDSRIFCNAYEICNNNLINMHKGVVTPEDVMVATRCMAPILEFDAEDSTGVVVACGSEIVDRFVMYYLDEYGNTQSEVFYSCMAITNAGDRADVPIASKLSKFDWAPRFITASIAGGDFVEPQGMFWDVENYSVITPGMLTQQHEVALLSMLTLDAFGSKLL